MNNLFTRTLTGLFIVLIVLGGFWFHPITFLLVGLTIVIGSQFELNSLLYEGGNNGYLYKGFLLSVPTFLVSPLVATGKVPTEIYLLLILLLIVVLISELYRKKSSSHIEPVSKGFLSAIYTTLPYILMVHLAFRPGGENVNFSPVPILAFFILLWINDTGAYLVGMAFGRHKLLERISPKKTWEGLVGGIILTLAAAWFAPQLSGLYTKTDWLILGALIAVFASFGDLFESLLKREAGVKDSGSILPGHGGFLDRFDGVTFAFPIVFLYITFFG